MARESFRDFRPPLNSIRSNACAGSNWLFTLKYLLLAKLKFDYSGKRRMVAFSFCRAHDTTIGAKDAITIAIQ